MAEGKMQAEDVAGVAAERHVLWCKTCPHNRLGIQCGQCHPGLWSDSEDALPAPKKSKLPSALALAAVSSASSDCYIMELPEMLPKNRTMDGDGNSTAILVPLKAESVVSLLSHFITEEQLLAAFTSSNAKPQRCPRVIPMPAKTVAKNKQTEVLDELAFQNVTAIAELEEQHEHNAASMHNSVQSTQGETARRVSRRVAVLDRTIINQALDVQEVVYQQQQTEAHEKYLGFVVAAMNPANMHAKHCHTKGKHAVLEGCSCKEPQEEGFHRFWCVSTPVAAYEDAVLNAGAILEGPDLHYEPPLSHAQIVSDHVDLIYFNKTPFNSPASTASPRCDMELAYDGDEDV